MIRLLLLAMCLAGAPSITPASFAISAVKVETTIATFEQGTKKKILNKNKLKKPSKRRLRRQRVSLFRGYRPEELFGVGLLLAVTGVGLLLATNKKQPEGFEGIIGTIIMRLFGTIAIILGGVTALIGGIWWIFDRYA